MIEDAHIALLLRRQNTIMVLELLECRLARHMRKRYSGKRPPHTYK